MLLGMLGQKTKKKKSSDYLGLYLFLGQVRQPLGQVRQPLGQKLREFWAKIDGFVKHVLL